MKKVIILTLVFLFASAAFAQTEKNLSDTLKTAEKFKAAVADGASASPVLKDPFAKEHVLKENIYHITFINRGDSNFYTGCHAFRIDKEWLLTAAHCVANARSGSGKVMVFFADIDELTQKGFPGQVIALGAAPENMKYYLEGEVFLPRDFQDKQWARDYALIYIKNIGDTKALVNKMEQDPVLKKLASSVKARQNFTDEKTAPFKLFLDIDDSKAGQLNGRGFLTFDAAAGPEEKIINLKFAEIYGDVIFSRGAAVEGESGSPVLYKNTIISLLAGIYQDIVLSPYFTKEFSDFLDASMKPVMKEKYDAFRKKFITDKLD